MKKTQINDITCKKISQFVCHEWKNALLEKHQQTAYRGSCSGWLDSAVGTFKLDKFLAIHATCYPGLIGNKPIISFAKTLVNFCLTEIGTLDPEILEICDKIEVNSEKYNNLLKSLIIRYAGLSGSFTEELPLWCNSQYMEIRFINELLGYLRNLKAGRGVVNNLNKEVKSLCNLAVSIRSHAKALESAKNLELKSEVYTSQLKEITKLVYIETKNEIYEMYRTVLQNEESLGLESV